MILSEKYFNTARALQQIENAHINDCVFYNGESVLKYSKHCEIFFCVFKWKYPLWYSNDINCNNIIIESGARSGIWYSQEIIIKDSLIQAEKTFRNVSDAKINNVFFPNALETCWNCNNISMDNVVASGDYFCFHSKNLSIKNLKLNGNYCFDSCENIVVENSFLASKDAFWNCKNITIKNCTIVGEYLCWNSENITLIDCYVESSQGFNTVNNLTITNSKLLKLSRAFENCTNLDVDVNCFIDSIMNPISGRIYAEKIGTIIGSVNSTDVQGRVVI